MNYRNNVFTFNTNLEAVKFVDYVERILKEYGRITLADLYDFIGVGCDYLANQVIWYNGHDPVGEHCEICPRYDSFKDWWYVVLPEPNQYPPYEYHATPENNDKTKETHATNQAPTPEPLNITVIMDMDPLKDPYTTIREVIQQATKIKDRPVFITIN